MRLFFQYKVVLILLIVQCATSCKHNESNLKAKSELFSKTKKTERLTKFIEKAQKAISVIPGVSVVVVDENGPLFIKSFGYADYENEIIANEQTGFYIASCTKSFNGLLANILAEEGKIDLSNEITKYAPFKGFNNKSAFENVSIMDLLSHQSGLENPYLTFRLAYSGQYENKEILKLIEEDTNKSETGKVFSYTNLGYYLLDALVQAELGESWKDLLSEKVFEPLEMNKTTAYISKMNQKEIALPHLGAFPDSIHKAQLMKTDKTMHPAGGLISNAEDISNFLSFYINKGSFQDKQVYPEHLVQETYKKQISTENTIGKAYECHGYGSGWLLGKLNEEDLVLHYGAYEGYRAHISFIPEKKIGIAVFINHELAMQFINEIVKYTYNLYLENETNTIEQEQLAEKELKELLIDYQNYIGKRKEKLLNHSWNLTQQHNEYTGVFTNNKMGTLEITQKDGSFLVTCGNMASIAIPHMDKDCMWVKLTSQSGEAICYDKLNGKVLSVNYKDNIFSKNE